MAFCNSCGATLADGTRFCNKCGAPTGIASAAPAATPPAQAPSGFSPVNATPTAAAPPPPAKGGSSALKIILIVIAVIIGVGLLGMVTCGFVLHRAFQHSRVNQNGDKVNVETPFGNISTDPDQTVKDLGVEIYPGAQVQKAGTAAVSFGSFHTVTGNFESSDSVDKVCDFYKSKFPNASVQSSDQNHCSIVSGTPGNQTTIAVQPNGDGSKFQIVSVSKK